MRRLVTVQVDLAKTELKADLVREGSMAAGLGASALAALTTINLLLVTAILALSAVLRPWLAGLCVSGAVLVVAVAAALIGWSRRVRRPLDRSRRELNQDVRFAKEKLA
jgi:hypothetical protein